ncbi:MAG: LacI family transcriptional regulator [Betaproteobacteria bacterium]|nr:MAG: LacI family transcriptional regulator [Betaproteobacteria bacterium]
MNLDPAQRTHQGHAAVTTLRDVARAAGVSIASASRALAGQRVGTEVHARIMAAASLRGHWPRDGPH